MSEAIRKIAASFGSTGMGRLRKDRQVFMTGNSLILTHRCTSAEGRVRCSGGWVKMRLLPVMKTRWSFFKPMPMGPYKAAFYGRPQALCVVVCTCMRIFRHLPWPR